MKQIREKLEELLKTHDINEIIRMSFRGELEYSSNELLVCYWDIKQSKK